jgi:putative copper resistance protein D
LFDETLRIALIYIHVIASTIWIGGSLTVALVLVPVSRSIKQPGAGPLFLRMAAKRFSRIGWVLLVVLILSGIGILDRTGIGFDELSSSSFWETDTGKALAIKSWLILFMMALSGYHDFVLGPNLATQLEGLEPGQRPPAGVAKARRKLVALARVNVLLMLTIAALGIMMFRGIPG